MIDVVLEGLARSTIAVAMSAVFASVLLAVLRPRSPRVHRVVWFLVILQVACWQPIGLPVLSPSPNNASTSLETAFEPSVTTIIVETPAPFPMVVPTASLGTPATAAAALETNLAGTPWSWKPILFGVWIVGASLLLLVGVVDCIRLQRRLTRETMAIPAGWLTDWQSLPNRGCELVATRTFGPLAIRTLRRSVVAVPVEFGDSLSPEQRRAVFSHELSHHQSGDPFWMLFVWLATSVQWFNPFVWLASRRFHAAAELACDDRLDEQSRLPLANVLLSLAQPSPRISLSMSGGALAARIRALAAPKSMDSKWKTPVIALCVIAAISVGWIRLEAKQPPENTAKKESKSLPVETPKKTGTTEITPEEIQERVDAFQARFQKKSEELEKLRLSTPPAKRGKKGVKAGKVEVSSVKDIAEKLEQKRREMAATKDEIQKVPDGEKLRAKHLSLQNEVARLTDELADYRNKLEFLVIRALRRTDPQDDDALALEKTLGYLAAREPRFGIQEILPNDEHVETEVVLKLEALLNRKLRPHAGETQRQALDRILLTPPSETRKRLRELRSNLEEAKSELPMWEYRKEYWLNTIADLFESVEKRKVNEVWPSRILRSRDKPDLWKQNRLEVLCYHAAIRRSPGATNAAWFDSPRYANQNTAADLLRYILVAETICKGDVQDSRDGAWSSLEGMLARPIVEKKRGGDARSSPLVDVRLHTLLIEARFRSHFQTKGEELRELINVAFPGAGLDRIMELEGKSASDRIDFFLNRQISVNFQGRGFANAFAELRTKAAVPVVVLAPNLESNLRPITLNAEAKWIDVVREVTRQAEMKSSFHGQFIVVGERVLAVGSGPVQHGSVRILDALSRANGNPQWRDKLLKPTTMGAWEMPTNSALKFLTNQTGVPVTILSNSELAADTPITIDVDRIPLAIALEVACIQLGCTWIPVGGSILVVPDKRKTEFEAKATDLRTRLSQFVERGKVDPAAKALVRPTFIDFSETPLEQGVLFLTTQHPGAQIELNVTDKEMPITIDIRGVPLAEGLALIAWNHDLKLTFDGSKAVLSDK